MFNNKIELILDNYPNFYYPGQTILGKIECFFSEDYFGALKIAYSGIAETRWVGEENYYDDYQEEEKTREVEYSDQEVYFNIRQVLVEGGNNYRVPPGKNTYPFSYILPQNLPGTFEGLYGNIRYKIIATMDPPSNPNHEVEKTINIVAPLDLNQFPNLRLREPMESSIDTTPCSFWCQNSGPITFTMSLPTTGFVPGQEVPINAYVENLSNINVENITFEIITKIEYITPKERNHEEEYLGNTSEGAVGAHGEKSWTAKLIIPTNRPIPNLICCNIIKLNHVLRAKLVLPFPHVNLFDELKIMIGTVPLSGLNINYSLPQAVENNSYAPTAPLIEDGNNSTNSFIPTPSQPGYGIEEGPRLRNPSQVPPYPGEMSSAPPTYDEAQLLKQKDEKSD